MITEDAIKVVFGMLRSVTTAPVYKYSRPKDATGTYFVINALPIDSGVLQQCVVNVNAYCNDVAPGIPDITKLTEMSTLTISTIDEKSDETNKVFLFFQQQNFFEGEEFQNHYSNMRFDAKLLNS